MDLQLTSATSVTAPTPPTQEDLRQIVMSNSDGASRAVFDFNKHSLAASMRQLGASSVVVSYSGGGDEGRIDDADFWKDLQTALTTIIGTGDGRSVIINAHSGVVLVKGMPSDIRAVENYLKATQVIVERQVMLEAKLVEVSLFESFQTGVNWAYFGGSNNRYSVGNVAPGTTLGATGSLVGNAGGITGGGTAGGFGATTQATVDPGKAGAFVANTLGKGFFGLAVQTANFAALMSFLETQGDTQVLSSPRVATINNQKAVLKVGTDEFFVTNVTTTTNSSSATTTTSPTITTAPFFSGIALDVTPQIDVDGNIILHIHPSISAVTEKAKNINLGQLGSITLPLASSNVNETDSIVRIRDGQIVAIGGLMQGESTRSRSGIPGTAGNPLTRNVLGNNEGVSRKKELVVLIKPTIIRNAQDWEQQTRLSRAAHRNTSSSGAMDALPYQPTRLPAL